MSLKKVLASAAVLAASAGSIVAVAPAAQATDYPVFGIALLATSASGSIPIFVVSRTLLAVTTRTPMFLRICMTAVPRG